MKFNALSIAATVLLAAGMAGHTAPAHAGDLTNAVLTCYVNTHAVDVLKPNGCRASWTPWSAYNSTDITDADRFEAADSHRIAAA